MPLRSSCCWWEKKTHRRAELRGTGPHRWRGMAHGSQKDSASQKDLGLLLRRRSGCDDDDPVRVRHRRHQLLAAPSLLSLPIHIRSPAKPRWLPACYPPGGRTAPLRRPQRPRAECRRRQRPKAAARLSAPGPPPAAVALAPGLSLRAPPPPALSAARPKHLAAATISVGIVCRSITRGECAKVGEMKRLERWPAQR
jgi:hypothetical protein